MTTLTEKELQAIRDFCDENEYDLRENYSGRCMMGDNCIGFVTNDNPFNVAMNLVAFAEQEDVTDLIDTFREARVRQDSMGLSTILYFQNIKVDETEPAEIEETD